MNEKNNRVVGSVINMINMLFSLIIGLVYIPILVKYLGDSEYGVYTLAMSLNAFLSILDLGFGNALVRYTAKVRAQGKEEKDLIGMFLLFYSVISLIAGIIGAVLYFNIESFFSTSLTKTEVTTLKAVFLIMLLNTVMTFPTSVFSSVIRSHEKFVFANAINLLKNIVNHVLMIVLVLVGFKSISLAVISLASTIVSALINIFYCYKKIKISIGFKPFEKSFYREVAVYSAFILINIIVDQLYANTDKIILGKVCGSFAVAVYGVGVTFQQYYQQFSTSISGVFLPHITKLSVGDNAKENMSSTFIKVGHVQLVILSLIAVGFAVYGKTFIELWVGKTYQDAYFIALLIVIPALIPLSQNIGVSILQAMNKHRIRSIMYVSIAIVNVVLSIPLAIKFGGIGSAIGTAIGNVLGQILFMNWFYWKKIGLDIPTYWKNFVSLIIRLIPVAGVFAITLLIPLSGWGGLLTKICMGMFFAVPYYYFIIINKDEQEMVKGILRKFKRV